MSPLPVTLTQDMLQPKEVDGRPDLQRDALIRLLGESRVITLEDGTGSAYGARVTAQNNVGVEGRSPAAGVETTRTIIGTTSDQLVPSREGRLQIEIQNLDSTNSVHIRFGDTAADTSDYRLDPGQSYRLPPGVANEQAVQAYATGASTAVVVWEHT